MSTDKSPPPSKPSADPASRVFWSPPTASFVANLAHEVRTPLHGLLGMIELTLGTELSAAQREYLEIAREAGERLLGALSAVLDVMRLERGEIVLACEQIETEAKLRRVLGPYIAEAGARGLRVLVEVGPEVPDRVLGDRLRLRQILDSLVSNAFKFTAEGEVSLAVFRVDADDGQECLEFRVRDTGIGISPDDQRGLFQPFAPFAPFDKVETRRNGGVGLGLYMAYQLVRLMGGAIDLTSTLGQGTLVSVRIPLQRVDGAAVLTAGRTELAIPPSSASRSSQRHANVLVVDDHPVNRMLATRILEEAGFRVSQAEDGAQALQALEVQRPDAVLMDCHMPVMDGIAATRAWREREQREGWTPIPIMALTAHAAPSEQARCAEAGMNDFMGKPYTARELIDMVERNLAVAVESTMVPVASQEVGLASDSVAADVDRSVLDGLHEALGDDLSQIMVLFLSQLDEQLQAVRGAVEARDAQALAAQAHSLKGSSGNLGLRGISKLASALEQAGRRDAFDGVDQALISLEQVSAATRQALAQLGYTAS